MTDEDRLSIPLDPEDALRAFMKIEPGSKEAKLQRIREATAGELMIAGHRDAMLQEAVDAGATPDDIQAALDAPR
jgi:hypothetical protein